MALQCLFAIVSPGDGVKVSNVCAQAHIPEAMLLPAHGTVKSGIRQMVGMDSHQKELVVSLGEEKRIKEALPMLKSQLHLSRAGHGIAFTTPLSGISLSTLNQICEEKTAEQIKNGEKKNMKEDYTHDLLVAVMDGEATDAVFDAARAQGCRGGTILHGRDAAKESHAFFGRALQPEKDILLVLCMRQNKQRILKAICEAIQKETGEDGIAFSLPVSGLTGLAGLVKVDS